MENPLTGALIGVLLVYLAIAVAAIALLWWIVMSAVRRAMRDHTIWQHTTWPAVKAGIDEGRLDERGRPKK